MADYVPARPPLPSNYQQHSFCTRHTNPTTKTTGADECGVVNVGGPRHEWNTIESEEIYDVMRGASFDICAVGHVALHDMNC